MPLFLQILEGPTAAQASPVFATGDPEIIGQVARALVERLGASGPPARVVQPSHPSKNPPDGPAAPAVVTDA